MTPPRVTEDFCGSCLRQQGVVNNCIIDRIVSYHDFLTPSQTQVAQN